MHNKSLAGNSRQTICSDQANIQIAMITYLRPILGRPPLFDNFGSGNLRLRISSLSLMNSFNTRR